MHDAFLRDWPNVIDARPIVKEDSFQTKPFTYLVNSNRHKYSGIDPEDAAKIREYLKDTIPPGKK